MPNTPITERRCADRIAISLPATLHLENRDFNSKILDISLCGLSLVSDQPLANQQNIKLTLSLPSYEQNNTLDLAAKVVRSSNIQHQYLVGLAFETLSPHQVLVIQEFSSFHNRQ